MNALRPALLLDRDGILVEDVDCLIDEDQIRLMTGAGELLSAAASKGFALAVVSNQTVVARGLATEAKVEAVNRHIQEQFQERYGVRIDRFYYCPHHPSATLLAYRSDCECRKPRPGMLSLAAKELGLDLSRSYMVGDRMSDIVAGSRAGCKTILVETGKHREPLIASAHHDASVRPDHVCADMEEVRILFLNII